MEVSLHQSIPIRSLLRFRTKYLDSLLNLVVLIMGFVLMAVSYFVVQVSRRKDFRRNPAQHLLAYWIQPLNLSKEGGRVSLFAEKMNDLLTKSFLSYVELKKQASKDMQSPELSDEPNLTEFFHRVDPIKSEMEEITDLLSDLEALNEETKSSHGAKVLRGLRDRIQSDTVAVLRKAKNVKTSLESLENSNITNRKSSELYREGTPIDRTRVSVTNGLRAKFRETMNEFLFLREKILSDYKKDLKRKYFVATGEEPSEETMEKITSGSGGVELMLAAAQGKKAAEDLQSKERHQAVVDIQRSLTKLHQVFLDMAVLVETQGERIDDIEENVAKAAEFVAGGTDNLYYAKQMKKEERATWIYCWAVAAAILVVLFVCLISLLTS